MSASLFDMSAEINALATDTLTIVRPSVGFDDTGRVSFGAGSQFGGVLACVQPASGRDMQKLPEGRRDSVTIKLYSSFEFKTGDRFAYEAEPFEVAHVDAWNRIGNYGVALAVKRG